MSKTRPKTLQELQNSPMERLKPLERLFDPDPRFVEMITFGDDADSPPTYTLEDHYRRYALLSPPSGAPEEVVGSYVTAQHLAILSWFLFPLSSVAESQAYGSLELALRRRMNAARARGLRARIEFAVREGWICPEKLQKLDPCLTPEAQRSFGHRPVDPDGPGTIEHLVQELPRDRNWLAHGNFSRGTDPFMTLDLVAQLLEQLYPD